MGFSPGRPSAQCGNKKNKGLSQLGWARQTHIWRNRFLARLGKCACMCAGVPVPNAGWEITCLGNEATGESKSRRGESALLFGHVRWFLASTPKVYSHLRRPTMFFGSVVCPVCMCFTEGFGAGLEGSLHCRVCLHTNRPWSTLMGLGWKPRHC